MDRPIGDEH